MTINENKSLSNLIWKGSEDVFESIANHTFIRGLADGNLSEVSFKYFLSQDILYLEKDATALVKLSELSKDKNYGEFFRDLANDGAEYERIMEDEYMRKFGVKAASKLSPVFGSYCDWLLHCVDNESYNVAVAAVCTCFWYYEAIGRCINGCKIEGNKYAQWIKSYSDEVFVDRVENYLKIIDAIGNDISLNESDNMVSAFRKSALFELEIFDECISVSKLKE